MSREESSLPYRDSKPTGAADFYFAINATFRFIRLRFGEAGLRQYWRELGQGYFAPVGRQWAVGGLSAVATYWQDFFAAEPGASVTVQRRPDSVVVQVEECPAIKHLRAHRRQIVPSFCQHCYFVGEAMAESAGLTVRVEGGGGCCQQTFLLRDDRLPPQDLTRIQEVSC